VRSAIKTIGPLAVAVHSAPCVRWRSEARSNLRSSACETGSNERCLLYVHVNVIVEAQSCIFAFIRSTDAAQPPTWARHNPLSARVLLSPTPITTISRSGRGLAQAHRSRARPPSILTAMPRILLTESHQFSTQKSHQPGESSTVLSAFFNGKTRTIRTEVPSRGADCLPSSHSVFAISEGFPCRFRSCGLRQISPKVSP
jgi:hypothetical protein